MASAGTLGLQVPSLYSGHYCTDSSQASEFCRSLGRCLVFMLLHEIGYTEPEYNANAWYMYIYATTALTTKMSRDKEHSMTIYACDCVCAGPPMGRVKLELTFNPDTSMVGVRLHEHTLSTTKTGSPFIVCIIVKHSYTA